MLHNEYDEKALWGKRVGFGITGSFCTFERVLKQVEVLVNLGAIVIPILSFNSSNLNTRFMKAQDLKDKLVAITGNQIIDTIEGAEPIGPKKLLDVMIIAPCTGNSLAKLATAVIDTPVIMAAKSNLRNGRPVIVAISTNDGLGNAAKNIGMLINAKNVYFVPFGQDDYIGKPNSLVACMEMIPQTICAALQGQSLQPQMMASDKM